MPEKLRNAIFCSTFFSRCYRVQLIIIHIFSLLMLAYNRNTNNNVVYAKMKPPKLSLYIPTVGQPAIDLEETFTPDPSYGLVYFSEESSKSAKYAISTDVNRSAATALFQDKIAAWQEASMRGDARASYNLGLALFRGENIKKDHVLAVQYFKKSAEANNINACFNLGWAYANGMGVAQSWSKALKYWTIAATNGHSSAARNIGLLYSVGIIQYGPGSISCLDTPPAGQSDNSLQSQSGNMEDSLASDLSSSTSLRGQARPDYIRAAMWYQRAAELGNYKAALALSQYYRNGLGVDQDIEKAVWYETQAAEMMKKQSMKDDLTNVLTNHHTNSSSNNNTYQVHNNNNNQSQHQMSQHHSSSSSLSAVLQHQQQHQHHNQYYNNHNQPVQISSIQNNYNGRNISSNIAKQQQQQQQQYNDGSLYYQQHCNQVTSSSSPSSATSTTSVTGATNTSVAHDPPVPLDQVGYIYPNPKNMTRSPQNGNNYTTTLLCGDSQYTQTYVSSTSLSSSSPTASPTSSSTTIPQVITSTSYKYRERPC